MDRSQLSDIAVFVEVARRNGFRAAAEALHLTPGAVSSSVQRFESRLGVRLLERSTRSVALTVPGEFLFSGCEAALEQISRVIDEISDQSSVVTGVLKISAPRRAGRFFLDELLVKYGSAFPQVKVDILYNDSKVDLVTTGIDIAVRSRTILDENTYAFPIGTPMPMAIVGSPKYLKQHGTPKIPNELINHDGICFAFEDSRNLAQWDFKAVSGTYCAMPKTKMVVNDIDALITYCEAGLGLAYTFAESVRESVEEKRLVAVLKKHVAPLPGFSINYLNKRHMPARVRAFIELAKQQHPIELEGQ